MTPRRGYKHHGLYCGEGRVVHFSGMSHWPRWRDWRYLPRILKASRVEEISLRQFCAGHGFLVVRHKRAAFTPEQAVARARSRLGEQGYATLSNNCEHFVNWCLEGRAQSWLIWRLLLILGFVSGILRFLAGFKFRTKPLRHVVLLVRSGVVSAVGALAMGKLTLISLRRSPRMDRLERVNRQRGAWATVWGVCVGMLVSFWGVDGGRRRWALLVPFLLPTWAGLLGYLWNRLWGWVKKS